MKGNLTLDPNQPLTPEERKRRHWAVQDTLGSFALEGLHPTEGERHLLRLYETGELSLEDLKVKAEIK